MGKKKLDVMAKEREVFIHGQVDEEKNVIVPGCVRNGIDEASANKIFDEMAEFAKYAFNKSHAACYAVVSYRTAYLKAYYPEELMAATLNSFLGNLDKIPVYIEECKALNIEILGPSINESESKFIVKNNKIRFGLASIKNVGTSVIDDIVNERTANGKFISFTDFCERMSKINVNKKCIESLIKAGAFDEFGKTRSTLLASFEDIIDGLASNLKSKMENQVSMFDLMEMEDSEKESKQYVFRELPEFDNKEFLGLEKEMLGIYLSGHPLEKFKNKIEILTNINSKDLTEIDSEMEETGTVKSYKDGQTVKIAGIISKVKKKITKNNSLMAFVTIDDLYGSFETIVFESIFNKCGQNIEEEKIVLVDGRLSIRVDEPVKIIASNIKEMINEDEKFNRINVNITEFSESKKETLRKAIRYYSKLENAKTLMEITINGEVRDCGKIFMDEEVKKVFYREFGKENIYVS
jgi:DNA polymerase-3 subunit alpha